MEKKEMAAVGARKLHVCGRGALGAERQRRRRPKDEEYFTPSYNRIQWRCKCRKPRTGEGERAPTPT
eukprot:scaffold8901_cov23-Tisochrysis_lutea.AAC.1